MHSSLHVVSEQLIANIEEYQCVNTCLCINCWNVKTASLPSKMRSNSLFSIHFYWYSSIMSLMLDFFICEWVITICYWILMLDLAVFILSNCAKKWAANNVWVVCGKVLKRHVGNAKCVCSYKFTYSEQVSSFHICIWKYIDCGIEKKLIKRCMDAFITEA